MRGALSFLLVLLAPAAAWGQEVVRLANMKFAHYGAVAYMKELAPKFGLKIEERIFAKGVDIMPAIVAGEIDAAASAAEAAIAGRASGAPIFVVAGFARGGARIVARARGGHRRHRRAQGQAGGGHPRRRPGAAAAGRAFETWPDLVRPAGQGRAARLPAYADLNQALVGTADRGHVPVGAAVVAGDQQEVRGGGEEALRHADGRAGADPGDHRAALPRAARRWPSAS